MANILPEGLPLPSSTREASQSTIQTLRVEVDALEKKLQESSKASKHFAVYKPTRFLL